MPRTADWRTRYPFVSHFATIGGQRMHYLDEGSGPPLLLVHGNPTWSFHWRHLILAMRERHRLIAPDHIGCGLSDKPQRYNYRLAQHIANLVEFVEKLDLRICYARCARLGRRDRFGHRTPHA